jgi:hypothetical protein
MRCYHRHEYIFISFSPLRALSWQNNAIRFFPGNTYLSCVRTIGVRVSKASLRQRESPNPFSEQNLNGKVKSDHGPRY